MPFHQQSPSVAVERALAMLEVVAEGSEGLSNAGFSRRRRIPKSSASYILRSLATRRCLNRDGRAANTAWD
jgi:DNA-binding IclR family transcriptional regulator